MIARCPDLEHMPYLDNARLIAAAPALLAACTHEVVELANLAAMVDPDLTYELMTSVYAAIAAAKGEQP